MRPSEKSEAEIFEAALEHADPGKRAAFLDQACVNRPELRHRIEQLLAAHLQAGEFLEGNAPAKTIRLQLPSEEKSGTKISHYRLLQKIGEGGCGIVYMAEQEEPVKRRVALKIIKLGMDTRQVVARFEAERQALALMDHPNIAKVLDAGATETGRPFFVMELVRGIKITEYCDQNKLPTEQRIQLFAHICHAIQHAHQKGIIHRDIKPSNILVTLHDGVPIPKVIDFGISKATQGRLTDQTLFTAFEQFIGTPAYMSPEQAEMSGLDIDTRSDIYSLGVLLYELLTGRTPFDQRELIEAGLDALRKTIREKDPQRPSTKLSTMEAGALINTAAQRHTDAPKLIHLLRGDLDWIVMKCLEKDRTRRYETANGLAVDLKRYLSDEPISARPPGKFYRLQKTIRRNKLAFTATAVTALALVAGTIVSTLQAVRASRAEAATRRERDASALARKQAETINRFLTEDLLYQATPEQNAREKKVTMEEVLEKASSRLEQSSDLAHQPEVEATLRIAVGSTYSKLGQWPEAKRHLDRAVSLRRAALGPKHKETLLAQKEVGEVLMSMNRFDDEGERLIRETSEGLKELAITNDGHISDTNLYRVALDVEAQYIWLLANRGKLERAIELKHENTAAYERAFGPDDKDTINELSNLTLLLSMRGDYKNAEQTAREMLKRYARIGAVDTIDAVVVINNLALYRLFQGDAHEAETLLVELRPRANRLFGKEHPVTLLAEHRLARVLEEQGRLPEAEALVKETLAVRRRVLQPKSGNTAYTMLVLGRLLVKEDQLDQAKPLLEEARSIFRDHYQLKPELAAQAENWLGAIHLAQKDYAKAEGLLLPASDQMIAPTAEMSPNERRDGISHLIQLYKATAKSEEADVWQRRLDKLGTQPHSEKSRQSPGSRVLW